MTEREKQPNTSYNVSAATNKWIRFGEFTVTYDITSSPNVEQPEVCDAAPHTAALVKAGESLEFNPQTAYKVERIEVFTDKGIQTIEPTEPGIISIPFDTDTQVYEVVMTASTEKPDLSPLFTTGIRPVAKTVKETPCYDLSGRRVANGTKGIYIQNGKKVIR